MLKWLMRRRVAAFEREWDYDMGYVRELLDADLGAVLALSKVMAMADYRRGVPLAPWYAAKLVATMEADCGPCAQLVVAKAERAGVGPAVIAALVRRDAAAMPEDVLLAFRFAERVLARDPEADSLREEVIRRWGRQGLASLAFAITAGGLLPILKQGLGHARACRRLTVAGQTLPVLREAAA